MARSSGERQFGCSLLSMTKLVGHPWQLSADVAPSNDEERPRPRQDKRQGLDLKHLSAEMRRVKTEINVKIMQKVTCSKEDNVTGFRFLRLYSDCKTKVKEKNSKMKIKDCRTNDMKAETEMMAAMFVSRKK